MHFDRYKLLNFYIGSGVSNVYTFGPTFRAEKSHTRRHLSEFYMIEAELVTDTDSPGDSLDVIMQASPYFEANDFCNLTCSVQKNCASQSSREF